MELCARVTVAIYCIVSNMMTLRSVPRPAVRLQSSALLCFGHLLILAQNPRESLLVALFHQLEQLSGPFVKVRLSGGLAVGKLK